MRLPRAPSEPLRIAAAVSWLPPHRDTVAAALAAGRLDEETADRVGYLAVAESIDHAAPEMAVLAAQKALAEAGWAGVELPLVVHAWLHHQGHCFWSPAHYVAHQVGAAGALAVGVQQMSNGGVAALELAATRMIADPAVDRCLVTTADRFAGPAFDRWCGDFDVAYGDGATAVLLSRTDGRYRLLSVVSASVPEYETMHRGDDPFSPACGPPSDAVDVRRTKRAFMSAGLMPGFTVAFDQALRRVIREAVAEAGLVPADPRVRYLVLPRTGRTNLTKFWAPPVRACGLRHAEVLELGRGTGHLGAGDWAANLADLHTGHRLGPGEVALLLSVGAGFTWSCVAVGAE